MARNEIIIRSDKGGQRTKTSAVGSVRSVVKKTSNLNDLSSGFGSFYKGLETAQREDKTGLFGLDKKITIPAVVAVVTRTVNKGIDIVLDIQTARTGEHVKYGNIKRIKGAVLSPRKTVIDATYGEFLRDMTIKRENIKNEYYRNLTGNLMYGKHFGDKR